MAYRLYSWLWLIIALTGCDSAAPSSVDSPRGNQGADFRLPALSDMAVERITDAFVGSSDASEAALCLEVDCAPGFVCEVFDGDASCRALTCDEVVCAELERCEDNDEGGAVCVDLRCDSDLDCPIGQFCNGVCEDAVCAPGVRRCDGEMVMECLVNGSGEVAAFPCSSLGTGFSSACVEPPLGNAYCTCRDEWDCPPNMRCEAGQCVGRPDSPSCILPPVPFEESLPTPELIWGGGSDPDELAADRPFGRSTQAVMTPLVANLDDDNGDGIVDSRDFPEIVFLTFHGNRFQADGILRAIHGGGPNQGQDLFAAFGDITWRRNDPLPDEASIAYGDADLDSTASPAIGDLDPPENLEKRPEIVAISEDDAIVIFDNTGRKVFTTDSRILAEGPNPAVSIANVDQKGFAEIVIGRNVFSVTRNQDGQLTIVDRWQGESSSGRNGQGAISCVADVAGLDRLQVIAGGTVYRFPVPPDGADVRADCTNNGGDVAPDTVDERAWCNGELPILWRAREVNGPPATSDGFCAIADILGVDQSAPPGPNNPLDGLPEVIVIGNGLVQIFNGQTGVMHHDIRPGLGERGGAPNVDDFDGDGFPEIGSAFATGYMMIDLQSPTGACPAWSERLDDGEEPEAERNPGGDCERDADCAPGAAVCNRAIGECVCLHNSWKRRTEDISSRVTGSTLFDFNGDGAAEVIYNDECYFRIYDGSSGRVLLKEPSESRTRVEYPIVADVDNDGNAEIVFATSTESGFCSERDESAAPPNNGRLADLYNSGIEVWGDPNDRWVSARRIWNQHSYHVTQITEDGQVPLREATSWRPLNGRFFNTYRSQPRTLGLAPDLVIADMQLAAPGDACGALTTEARVTVLVENQGDLRVGPGVELQIFGEWPDGASGPLRQADGSPLATTLMASLEPGESIRLSLDYDASTDPSQPPGIPNRFSARIDAGGDPTFGRSRECREDNNEISVDTEPPPDIADLAITEVELNAGNCPTGRMSATVENRGRLDAENAVVRFFAGDPSRGGSLLAETTIDGVIAPGASQMVEAQANELPPGSPVTVYAVVDPDDRIPECEEGNNIGEARPDACRIP